MSEEETRSLAELKKDLEERIARTERELNFLKISMGLVNEALAKGSFRPASRLMETGSRSAAPAQAKGEPYAPQQVEEEAVILKREPAVSSAAPSAPVTLSASTSTPTPAPSPAPRPAPTPVPAAAVGPEEDEQAFAIKSKLGEDLGIFYVGNGYVRVVPRSDFSFSAKTPPFQSFFIDRVLGEMHRKDEMSVEAGAKDPSSMIGHEIKREGDIIKEIVITNIDEEARIRELRSSIRWTLERMLEKGMKK